MNNNDDNELKYQEIIKNLHTLGLNTGASQNDIKAAFRKLALEYHPDVNDGSKSFKFIQVSNAYAVLKNLTADELNNLPRDSDDHESFKAKIDFILDHCERELKNFKADDSKNIKAVIFRLNSNNPAVINVALKHSEKFANDQDFLKALAKMINSGKFDNESSRLIGSLKFNTASRKFLANEIAVNNNLPLGLILSIAGQDYDVMQKLLTNAAPEAVAPILRRWPANKIPDENIINMLLTSNDPVILVPVLSMMKIQFKNFMYRHKKRIDELNSHPSPAVRAWTK